jgi:DNA (cytosine-5)-methyltransferase 1
LFEEIGYYVNYKKLNSSDFGCPQSRERVYIICNLEKNIPLDNIEYNKHKVFIKDVIDYDDTETDIEPLFAKKIIELHCLTSVYGCKIGDKRGGANNIHSWDIGYNGEINNDERLLMKNIMLERRKKHWSQEKGIAWMDGVPLTYDEILTFNYHENLMKMLNNLVEKKYLKIEKCKDLINGKREYKKDSDEGYNICKGKLSFHISKILDPLHETIIYCC